MKPNTPHAVYTVTNSIYKKGHFFGTTTLKDTLSSVIHNFIVHTNPSDSSHKQTRYILQRIIVFYHSGMVKRNKDVDGKWSLHAIIEDVVTNASSLLLFAADPSYEHIPNLETMESVMDAVSACAIGIFINILDFETYRFQHTEDEDYFRRNDLNAMTKNDRMACTYVRGLSWSLLQWLNENLEIQHRKKKCDLFELMETYFVDISLAIRSYKILSDNHSVRDKSGFELESLDHQLTHLFDEDTQFHRRLMKEFNNEATAMDFDTSGYTVKRRDHPLKHKYDCSLHSMISLGLNPADKLYYCDIYGDIETFLNEMNVFESSKKISFKSVMTTSDHNQDS